VQVPALVGRTAAEVGPNDFLHPTYRAVWELVTKAGGPSSATPDWPARLRDAATDPAVSAVIAALAVEPMATAREVDEAYVALHVHRLLELTVARRIADLKSRLQRTNPVEHATEYNRMFGELVALEQHRRALRDKIVGGS
jgi:DNA primase